MTKQFIGRTKLLFALCMPLIACDITEVKGLQSNANFSTEYIQQHKGTFRVEIPEVHELANIMVAISKIGRLDSNMVDMRTDYHASVMKHFKPFDNHAAIDTLNKYITGVLDQESYWYYYALKMNACGYLLNKDGEIINDNIIQKMGFESSEDPFVANAALFQDFAIQSGFRQFYRNHKTYYDSLVSSYRLLNPIGKMQQWLEDKFPYDYEGYLVTFSPLVNGAHATQQFENNGYKQTVMFVCSAHSSDKYNQNENEMRNSRVVFTEIDHNFVNPVSYQYSEQIDLALTAREKWVKEGAGTGGYGSPLSVFNEYMTWAIFSQYCYDHYPEVDASAVISHMEKQMVNRRGFILFDKFNQQLIAQYKGNPEIEIDALYKEMIAWCIAQ
jgi:hypothetical protein